MKNEEGKQKLDRHIKREREREKQREKGRKNENCIIVTSGKEFQKRCYSLSVFRKKKERYKLHTRYACTTTANTTASSTPLITVTKTPSEYAGLRRKTDKIQNETLNNLRCSPNTVNAD
jgi:hypothetical protein